MGMVNPYGEGICSYPAEEQGKIGNRIFENIPVNDETAFSRATLLNCYVDGANNCRRIFTLGPQPAQNQARQVFANSLIEWLATFEKQDGDCLAAKEDDVVETA